MMKRRYAAIAIAAILLCASPALAQDKKPPLRTGVDGTFAPHAMPKLGGGVEGFQIDVFTEVAKRMKRDITIDAVSFSTLIPGMQSGRYDFIAAPTTVTKERAENMLFTAGYLWTAFQFGIKKGSGADQELGRPQGQGRRGQQGHALRDARQEDGRGARLHRAGLRHPARCRRRPCSRAAPTPRSAATPRSSTPRPRTRSSSPTSSSRKRVPIGRRRCPKDNPKLRAELQDALDCMKKDGTMAKFYEKWFNKKPAADDLAVVVTPGYGVPGMPGYDPTPHELKCD